MNDITYIYALCDSRDPQEVRYIGKTVRPKGRLHAHVCNAKHGVDSHLYNWIRKIIKENAFPLMKIVDQTREREKWQDLETMWIELCRYAGYDLVNSTNGGEGVTATPEIRQKMSKAARERKREPVSEETKQKLREAHAHEKKYSNEEERRKIRYYAHRKRRLTRQKTEQARFTDDGCPNG